MDIKNNTQLNKKFGFTLIELLVTLGIISIVLMMAYSMNIFANKTYSKGTSKSDVQSTLRLAADYVTKQLRYSSNVEILASKPAVLDSGKDYIYVDSSGSLVHYSGGTTKIIADASGGLTTTMEFQQQDYQTVYFKLSGSLKGESYSVDSSVLALNLGDNVIKGVSPGAVISFNQGQPTMLDKISVPVTSITITAPSTTVVTGGGTLQLTGTVSPSNASIQTVTWSVDNTSAASINPNTGLLTVNTSTSGVVLTVKATANDGSGVTKTYAVTTTFSSVKMTSFNVSSASNYIFNNGGTLQMNITNIQPINATDQTVTWSIDKDSSIATINSTTGLLTANTTSSTSNIITVTATATNAITVKAAKQITIIPKITGVAITGNSSMNDKNSSLQLALSITPSNASTSTAVSWSVSGDANASISSSGLLQSGRGNNGQIYANKLTVSAVVTALDGSKYTATKIITINH